MTLIYVLLGLLGVAGLAFLYQKIRGDRAEAKNILSEGVKSSAKLDETINQNKGELQANQKAEDNLNKTVDSQDPEKYWESRFKKDKQ